MTPTTQSGGRQTVVVRYKEPRSFWDVAHSPAVYLMRMTYHTLRGKEITDDTPGQSGLEAVMGQQSVTAVHAPQPTKGITILPLEVYIGKFESKYANEPYFHRLVHAYLGLSRAEELALNVSKVKPSLYQKRVHAMITRYAAITRQKLIDHQEKLATDLEQTRNASQAYGKATATLQGARQTYEQTNAAARAAQEKAARDVEGLDREKQERLAQIAREKETLAGRVVDETSSRKLAEQLVRRVIASSEFFEVDDHGNFTYKPNVITEKLEDILLKQFILEIEAESGPGFLTRTKQYFEDGPRVLTMPIEHVQQMRYMALVPSIIRSRQHGYRLPVYPFINIKVPEKRPRLAQTGVDSAISIDYSGSMGNNNRYVVAHNAALAVNAFFRKLSNKNKNYISVFHGDTLNEVSSAELIQMTSPSGGTPTHRALEWFIEKLGPYPNKPAIANLVTDGFPEGTSPNRDKYPDYIDYVVMTAGKLKNYPHIQLCVYLVDSDSSTLQIIKRIGMAAGSQSKVLMIDSNNLGTNLLKGIAANIGQLHSIQDLV